MFKFRIWTFLSIQKRISGFLFCYFSKAGGHEWFCGRPRPQFSWGQGRHCARDSKILPGSRPPAVMGKAQLFSASARRHFFHFQQFLQAPAGIFSISKIYWFMNLEKGGWSPGTNKDFSLVFLCFLHFLLLFFICGQISSFAQAPTGAHATASGHKNARP